MGSNNEVEILDKNEVIDSNSSTEVVEVLDETSAKQLTEDIKSTTTALYILLKKAHDTKAWMTLGYKSWTDYISGEFDFSRARSYQLINQANVIEEINKASGLPLYISERDARSIKKRLPEITKKLEKAKESDIPDEEMEDEVRRIVGEGKESIDNSEDFANDEGGFGVGGASEDDYGDSSEVENYSERSVSFPPKIITFYENVLGSFEVFEKASPIAIDIGKYIKSSEEDKEEFLRSAKSSISMIKTILNEIERGV